MSKSDIAVAVRELSKSYTIAHNQEKHSTLAETVLQRLKNPLKREATETFWALKDVSFDIKKGDVVGIIGRNGAGKSTLLKVLSRITEPTKGEVQLYGRVGSLLEVGTGFHPELTGRENVYLNGAILGMTKGEIRKQFDAIVDFAEVEKFLDTPVKRYSSGMYVRLAFAVAAHLNPEILIVDEVLSVGDASFQKKCLGKMGEVAEGGRTVLLVSHNMTAVKSLCSFAIMLASGKVLKTGDVSTVADAYARSGAGVGNSSAWPPERAPGNEDLRLMHVAIAPGDGEPEISIDSGVEIEIGFINHQSGINLDCTAYIATEDGILLFESGCIISTENDARTGPYIARTRIPPHLLNVGRYCMHLVFGRDQRHVIFKIDEVASFQVENTATGRGHNLAAAPGIIRPLLKWEWEHAGETTTDPYDSYARN
jgi:lipopolysaccharide transport system ATP-binding protein